MKRVTARPGLDPIFDLGRTAYFLDFILVPVASTIALWAAGRELAVMSISLIVLAGFVGWTLAEYWIHRLVFHGKTRFAPMHQMHHALPKDLIGIASWGTFAGFATIYGAIWLISNAAPAAAITAGLMLGYLFYCAIHVRMHHGERTRFGRYTAFMFAHHAGHHRGGEGNFGVTSPIWDFVFGTFKA